MCALYYPFASGKRFYRAAISADTKASDFDILWVNYWAYPGTELQVAEQYAKEHGLGWVIMVRDLPRKQAREDPCKEPTEGSR